MAGPGKAGLVERSRPGPGGGREWAVPCSLFRRGDQAQRGRTWGPEAHWGPCSHRPVATTSHRPVPASGHGHPACLLHVGGRTWAARHFPRGREQSGTGSEAARGGLTRACCWRPDCRRGRGRSALGSCRLGRCEGSPVPRPLHPRRIRSCPVATCPHEPRPGEGHPQGSQSEGRSVVWGEPGPRLYLEGLELTLHLPGEALAVLTERALPGGLGRRVLKLHLQLQHRGRCSGTRAGAWRHQPPPPPGTLGERTKSRKVSHSSLILGRHRELKTEKYVSGLDREGW